MTTEKTQILVAQMRMAFANWETQGVTAEELNVLEFENRGKLFFMKPGNC